MGMRRFKLTLLLSSASFFFFFFAFWEFGAEWISPYYEISFQEKVSVAGALVFFYLLFLALFLHRFSSPLERIIDAIIPYDEDFSTRLAIENWGRNSPFTQFAISLNTLIEKAGSHIQHSREKDREMEGILDSLNEGVIAFNVLSKVTFVNDKACDMLKISRVDLIGKSLESIRDVGGLFRKCHDIVIKALQTSEMASEKWVSEDVFFDLVASSLVHQTGAILVLQDKTSDWKMVELGKNFIANSSHELRTPITIIRGFAEMLTSKTGLSPKITLEITNKIVRTCDRLDKLVKSLLTITDLENFSEDRFQPCNLMSLLENCKYVLVTAYPDVEITMKGLDEKNFVLGDFGLLDLAITNLLENAVKYSSVPKKIQINVQQQGPGVSISVQDHGIGIPLKDLPHIFDRFYTVDKARSRKSGGAGLGLSMVKLVIEKHHGEISVTSEPGKGSCFTLKIPLHE